MNDESRPRSVPMAPAIIASPAKRIEALTGARITMIGVGADREHTIELSSVFR